MVLPGERAEHGRGHVSAEDRLTPGVESNQGRTTGDDRALAQIVVSRGEVGEELRHQRLEAGRVVAADADLHAFGERFQEPGQVLARERLLCRLGLRLGLRLGPRLGPRLLLGLERSDGPEDADLVEALVHTDV